MPDLIAEYNSDNTLTNVGLNYRKNVKSQSGVGKEWIVSIARSTANGGVTNTEINAVVEYLTMSHGSSGTGDAAFTIGAIGTADGAALTNTSATELVYMRVQGTGDFTAATADMGISNLTVAKVCVFEPAT